VSDSSQIGAEGRPLARAAQYVRMSTEHQKYSTLNQAEVILQYAARRGLEIVQTYADQGKSGLRLDGRDALKRLISDVETGKADFQTILVYDISRWGRFQDADESAYYEYVCKRAGITVQYCAEQFENDGSPFSTIVKGVKRAMAGEYSRELSAKVFAGQCRLIELGFRQGGPAGYGLRRELVDQTGIAKARLTRREYKSIQTDRVVLVPGPEDEIRTVRWIYRKFIEDGLSERDIAAILNEKGVAGDLGRPWTRSAVHQVLINEKYVGNNVWNRISFKLKKKRITNQPGTWIRADNVFESVVDRILFDAAQLIIRDRSLQLSDDDMLDRLRLLYESRGYLSAALIDEAEHLPASGVYARRFGGLRRAYEMVGFTSDQDYRYININRALRALHPRVIADTVSGIKRAGGSVAQAGARDLIIVNDEFTVSIVIARCFESTTGLLRWPVHFDTVAAPDITVAVRMNKNNSGVLDYYLLPSLDMCLPRLRLAEYNGLALDCYRFASLEPLFGLVRRTKLQEAA